MRETSPIGFRLFFGQQRGNEVQISLKFSMQNREMTRINLLQPNVHFPPGLISTENWLELHAKLSPRSD